MPKYVSRRYLKEKWEKLKWDMEETLDVYSEYADSDKVDIDTVQRCYRNIIEMCNAIQKEVDLS